MCGIVALVGPGWRREQLEAALDAQAHRGPDDRQIFVDSHAQIALGSARLSIVDRTDAGRQPMVSPDRHCVLAFNGEIYNAPELRAELADYPFRGHSDTEVLLAAYRRWGAQCVDRLEGMFAFALWDGQSHTLVCARDRFGVKPLYLWHDDASGRSIVASEIKAIGAAGISLSPDLDTWRQYLAFGLQDHSSRTSVANVTAVPAGHLLKIAHGRATIERWYDLAARVRERYPDTRADADVIEEYRARRYKV